MTIDNSKNPWQNMVEGVRRRVESTTPHDLFWITDLYGNYGFLISSKKKFIKLEKIFELKGISLLKKNNDKDNGELYLILNNKEDWQIFLTLCVDLVKTTQKHESDEKMIDAVEDRLKRWQQLLKQNLTEEITLEKQMGLFSELICLKDIIMPKIDTIQAITSWVGPDFDKQDFLLEEAIIEIKSYRTSKGSTVQISSANQLVSDKEPLFLISFALTTTENGMSVKDISDIIFSKLEHEPIEAKQIFESKLIEYGYAPEVNKSPLLKFIIDKQNIYEVSTSFPKITPKQISNQISSVKYSIDLSKCEEFKVELNSIFNHKK